jgi:hypothetical protein
MKRDADQSDATVSDPFRWIFATYKPRLLFRALLGASSIFQHLVQFALKFANKELAYLWTKRKPNLLQAQT